MKTTCTRHQFLGSMMSFLAVGPVWGAVAVEPDIASIESIERKVGGRVGVFALDTASGRTVSHRADERFAMCSTFKWLLAAAVLQRVDRGTLKLEQALAYGPNDLLSYAPVARKNVGRGQLTIAELAQAVITLSDNTAANLLLDALGGPIAITAFARQAGDSKTRLDRNEPSLNTNERGDERDTTTPRAMVQLMQHVLCGDVLSKASLRKLKQWLYDCETGQHRLRAGFPAGWIVGDKTGSGSRGAFNDVAIAYPGDPDVTRPVLVAAYISESTAPSSQIPAMQSQIARLVVKSVVNPAGTKP